MIVVDASVVVEFLLGRGATVTALTAELTGARDEALHAPDLIEPEALNALRGLERGRVISRVQARRAVSELDRSSADPLPPRSVRDRV